MTARASRNRHQPRRIWSADDVDDIEGYIEVTFRVWQGVDGNYVGECSPFRIGGFGDSPDAALESALNATLLLLDFLQERGDLEAEFKARGVEFVQGRPPKRGRRMTVHQAEMASMRRLFASAA